MTDLGSILDLADLAVSRCEDIVTETSRDDLASVVHRVRGRSGFIGEVLVVAFVGGTGSGKSSLVNGLVGVDVAQIGVARPTTDTAFAVTPQDSYLRFDRLFVNLGVSDHVEAGSLHSLVLVDLPDFDSTVEAHRRVAQEVLPRVDAVVWVFDSEKYADSVIHREFLAGLTPYTDQFVFVLNKVDRLGESTDRVAAHLRTLLVDDGFPAPEVVETVASGELLDVSQLRESLVERLDIKRTSMSKLLTDLRLAANDGWSEVQRAISQEAPTGERADRMGLSSATFVWLGVEATGMLHGMMEV